MGLFWVKTTSLSTGVGTHSRAVGKTNRLHRCAYCPCSRLQSQRRWSLVADELSIKYVAEKKNEATMTALPHQTLSPRCSWRYTALSPSEIHLNHFQYKIHHFKCKKSSFFGDRIARQEPERFIIFNKQLLVFDTQFLVLMQSSSLLTQPEL